MTSIAPRFPILVATPHGASPFARMDSTGLTPVDSRGSTGRPPVQNRRSAVDAAADTGNSVAQARPASGVLAAQDSKKLSSRSLTPGEKQIVRSALENARDRLDRTELALTGNWLKRVPGSTLTNKELFRQYFGNNTETMRAEVLTRLQRVQDKVQNMLGQDMGNTVVRATGRLKGYSAFVQPSSGKETVYLGDRFFGFRSSSAVSMNSQAGVFVHELFHLVQYNGKKGVDDVPGYASGDKGVYTERALKQLANTSPELAVRNNNLFMWYVERQK